MRFAVPLPSPVLLSTVAVATVASFAALVVFAPEASAQQPPPSSNGQPAEPRQPRALPPKRPPDAAPPTAEKRAAEPGKSTARSAQKRKGPAVDTPEDRAKALANLYAHLATAADTGEAAKVTAAIEGLWAAAAGDTAALLLARATQAMVEKRTELAQELFDAAVEIAPDFADGFARRAYFHFTENQTTRALGDLRRALALEPNHYRALDGMAKILRGIGEKKAALKALKQLELVHPQWPGLADELKDLEREVEGQGI